jgi:DNA-binding transcriptional MerR regulator
MNYMNYMLTGQVAQLLGISKRTLQNWLRAQKIEPPMKATNGYYLWSIANVQVAQEYKTRLQTHTNYNIGGDTAA